MSKNNKNSGKRNTANNKKEAPKKEVNFLPIIATVAAVVSIAVVVLVNRNGTSDESGRSRNLGNVVAIADGDSLLIPTADITATASFFPLEVDGTEMEVLAVKASDGTIRTAFNTCQVCYDSGRGYYVQSGNTLVCQNCGNRFLMDQVGIESGGCNPWPIFSENKTVTDETISISYDFLTQARSIFSNWKANY